MKPQAPGRAGHDRWLVSYADLVTLLLAFFTTLYAASSVDARKMTPLSASLQSAFAQAPGHGAQASAEARALSPEASSAGDPVLVPAVQLMPKQSAMEALRRTLDAELAQALAERRVEVIQDARGLVISMPEHAAFAPGGAGPSDVALQLIDRIAATVRDVPNPIRIEGHTDDVPISTARFSSNWELSTARASAVVAHLITSVGIAPGRLSAAGYGEFHPRMPNDSAENRARNRRIDIVILDGENAR